MMKHSNTPGRQGSLQNRRDEPGVTPKRRIEDSEFRYRTLFENVPIGLYITTPDGRIIDANPALVGLLGYPDKQSLLGKKAADLYSDPADRAHEQSLFAEDHVVENYETQLRRRDGETIWVRDTCCAIRDETGAIVFYEGSLQNITAEKRAEEELVYMARHDPLTGLFNRHTLRSILDSEVCRARRYKHPVGVLMIDVDRFKEINDRFGHATGDKVLRAVADVLRETVRESDIVVRYGGDEFLVLLIETNGETDIVRERIQCEMSKRRDSELSLDLPVTVAIGTAHWMPETGQSIETVLSQADRTMYEEKRRGASNDTAPP